MIKTNSVTWAPLPARPPTPPVAEPHPDVSVIPFTPPGPVPNHATLSVRAPGPSPIKSPTNKLASAAASDLLGTLNMTHLAEPSSELFEITNPGIELQLPPSPLFLRPPGSPAPEIKPLLLPSSSAGVAAAHMNSPFPGCRALLPAPSVPPTPPVNWPPPHVDLLRAIRFARSWKSPAPSQPIFKFRPTLLAAKHNMEILHQFNYDFKTAIMHDPNSPLHPGSEFRPVSILAPVFKNHPSWNKIYNTLTCGGHYPLLPLSNDYTKSDLEEGIAFGNHKSAVQSKSWMMDSLTKEIIRGWQVPLLSNKLHRIPGALVAPLGCQKGTTINENGDRIPKNRLTHNQSMKFSSGHSINSRVIEAQLSPSQYGYAFIRFIHLIVALRLKFPTARILLNKFDFKSAYRRVQNDPEAITHGMVTLGDLCGENIALASLRLTFGGKPCPSIFSEISEATCDLANAIARIAPWDIRNDIPTHASILQDPIFLENDIPLAPALPLLVDPCVDEYGGSEVFIDDIFSAFLDLSQDHIDRGQFSPLLAIETLSRPSHEHKPLPRDDLLALEKAVAEGTPNEMLIVLGWELNARKLLVILPFYKAQDWSTQVTKLIVHGSHLVSHKELDTLVGRLQHIASVFYPSSHFLGRLRSALQKAEQHGSTRLNKNHKHDLQLWLSFIAYAHSGVSMNLLTFRVPTRFKRTDACGYGLGGYDLKTGRAWRWIIPTHLQGLRHINFLEFLAAVTGILLDSFEDPPQAGDSYLSGTDNMSTMGWLRKSNFDDTADHEAHMNLARFLALWLIHNKVGLLSHWLAGEDNGVSDRCSRLDHPSCSVLTNIIGSEFPQQVPDSFNVIPLPPELALELCSWVQHGRPLTELPPLPHPKLTHTGPTGSGSSSRSSCQATPFFKPSQSSNVTSSSPPSPKPSGIAPSPSPHLEMINWLQEHALPPSTMWLRPLKRQVSPTPH